MPFSKRCFLAMLLFALGSAAHSTPRIAIIIDDMGYQRAAGERALALPGRVSYAFLPDAPWAATLARSAHSQGKDVLLHLPLQSASEERSAEPGVADLDTTHGEFRQLFNEHFGSVPHVVGVNTHQGSLLTRHPGHMRWLMDEIVARGDLFFVDSYTTKHSVALRIANESGVPSVKRDVFLDHDGQAETLASEFERLKHIATKQGYAVGIGHPYRGTLEFLERALSTLHQDGFELVPISEVIALAAGSETIKTAADPRRTSH